MKLYYPTTEVHRRDMIDRLRDFLQWESKRPTNMRSQLQSALNEQPGTTGKAKPFVLDILDSHQRRTVMYYCPSNRKYKVVTTTAKLPISLQTASKDIIKDIIDIRYTKCDLFVLVAWEA